MTTPRARSQLAEKLKQSLSPSWLISLLAFSLLLFAADGALAHARWKIDGPTPPRDYSTGHKQAPCGNIPRGEKSKTFIAGQNLVVTWEETINHPGYFRILFSPENDQNFEASILKDNIPQVPSQQFYETQIQLPETPCEACTLQLIQVMLDDPQEPYYYSCSDIRLITEEQAVLEQSPTTQITDLQYDITDQGVKLAWKNPTENFFGVVIVRSSPPLNKFPDDSVSYSVGDALGNGVVIYNGSAAEILDEDAEIGESYYYSVFAYNPALYYQAPQSVLAFVIEKPNTRPGLSLFVLQNGQQTVSITPSGGEVIVQLLIIDDLNDAHTTQWTLPEGVININNLGEGDIQARRIVFDPSGLSPGTLTFSVLVTDDGEPNLSTIGTLELTVEDENAQPPTEAGQTNTLVILGLLLFGWMRKR